MSKFMDVATEIGKLVEEKNAAYGDSYAKTQEFIKLLYPSGVKPEQYQDMLTFVRMFDKMMRRASKPGYGGEDEVLDLLGYALLYAVNNRDSQHAEAALKFIDSMLPKTERKEEKTNADTTPQASPFPPADRSHFHAGGEHRATPRFASTGTPVAAPRIRANQENQRFNAGHPDGPYDRPA